MKDSLDKKILHSTIYKRKKNVDEAIDKKKRQLGSISNYLIVYCIFFSHEPYVQYIILLEIFLKLKITIILSLNHGLFEKKSNYFDLSPFLAVNNTIFGYKNLHYLSHHFPTIFIEN